MMKYEEMTNKQKILQMVERWPDDISFKRALYHMVVLQKVEEGLEDVRKGRVYDHDEVFAELLDENEENKAGTFAQSKARSPRNQKVDRARRAKNGSIRNKTNKTVHR